MHMAQNSNPPMHLCHVNKLTIFMNRAHMLVHSIALSLLLYYRASFFFFSSFHDTNDKTPAVLLWLIVFAAELVLSFEWLLLQAFRWRPVSRSVFPERLPRNDKLPAVDVFICTADPEKEPPLHVMNTVLSAMALDYPPEKLNVYLSDDGGADVTLNGMREAWRFAKWWLPFCNRFNIKCRSPQAYFSAAEDNGGDGDYGENDFLRERQTVKDQYEKFRKRVTDYARHGDTGSSKRRDLSAVIQVIKDNSSDEAFEVNEEKNMPLLVYVAREKRLTHPHHFKAGALNVLLRVSGVISNSPFILGLDCDMYCNGSSSARQAMCFHLDPELSPSLALVQFPQKFHNISQNDIYDSQLRSVFSVLWHGFDGIQGPCVSGTGYYIKRKSLYGSSQNKGLDHKDPMELKQIVGLSNEFVKSLLENYKPNVEIALQVETQQLASCTYEDGTKWGEEAGYLYASVVEDYFTGFVSLHCKGWNSVYCDPSTPQFLGSGCNNLNDFLVQGTRWSTGLVDVAISKYCPLIYGPSRTSFLESMCYAYAAIFPLCDFFSLWCFATLPQICLINGIPLYPEVSNAHCCIFSFIFVSSVSRHLYEVLTTGSSLQLAINEQRIWMIKAVTCHTYGSFDAIMKRFGLKEASFFPTNKVDDIEQLKRYNMGVFDFKTSSKFLVPLASLVILNMASLVVGIGRVLFMGEFEKLFIQVFIPFYVVVMNYPIIEGMLIRTDNGRIQTSVTLISAIVSTIFCILGSIIFK